MSACGRLVLIPALFQYPVRANIGGVNGCQNDVKAGVRWRENPIKGETTCDRRWYLCFSPPFFLSPSIHKFTPAMDAPAVILVPPTPLNYNPSTSSTPSSSSSYPPQSPRFSTSEQRASSETTIFSIYSMYGDDQTRWSAATVTSDQKSNVQPNLTLMDNRYSQSNGYPSSQLAYYETDLPNITHENDLGMKLGIPFNSRILGPRPLTHAPQPSLQLSIPEADHRPMTSHSYQTTSTSSVVIAPSASLSSNRTPPSKNSSRSSPVFYGDLGPPEYGPPDQELPPLPPSQSSSIHPSPSPSPFPIPRHLSPALRPPASPKSLPLKHPISSSGSPGSISSLVPSEGEDMDAFHVRNTYAQLETTGVKGDGYEEGVERTRARLGASRSSQLDAEAAIGDGTEKSRELHPKEIETLRTVDRWVTF